LPGFNLGPFGFSISRPETIDLEVGKIKIIAVWSWKKFGWVRKKIQIDENGNIIVEKICL